MPGLVPRARPHSGSRWGEPLPSTTGLTARPAPVNTAPAIDTRMSDAPSTIKVATRALGSSGLDVSAVGLGCNNFGRRADLKATRAVVDAALSDGVTFFDTADTYGTGTSEEYLGEV